MAEHPGDAGRTVDLAHEALIGGWPTLQGWVGERREAEQTRRQLETKASEWDRLDRKGGLLDEAELAEAERWLASEDAADLGYSDHLAALTAASRQRIDEDHARDVAQAKALADEQAQRADEQARSARRLRKWLLATGIFAMVAVLAATVAGFYFNEADDERDRAEENEGLAIAAAGTAEAERANAVAAQATAEHEARVAQSRQFASQVPIYLDGQLDLALLLSLEAMAASDTVEAEASLLRGVQANPQLDTFLSGYEADVSIVAFSHNGATLATGHTDGTIVLWNVAERQPLGPPLPGHEGVVLSLAFSPDDTVLVSGSDDGTIRLRDLATGDPGSPVPVGRDASIMSVTFSPDGNTIAAGSMDGAVVLWTISGEQRPRELEGTDQAASIWSVAFSPDGTILAAGSEDGTITLWDVETETPLAPPLLGHEVHVLSLAFSPDGTTLASGDADGAIGVWDVGGNAVRPRGEPGATPVIPGRDGTSPAHRGWLMGHRDSVRSLAFTPDGQTLASGSADESVGLWHVSGRWQISEPLTGQTDAVLSISFSPDGVTMASAHADGEILLWEVADTTALGSTAVTREAVVNSVAYSPDGSLVAAGDANGMVTLHDLAHPGEDAEIRTGQDRPVRRVAFTADGETLVITYTHGVIVLWPVTAGAPADAIAEATAVPAVPVKEGNFVYDVAVSPDGAMLAVAMSDRTITLWDIAARTAVHTLRPVEGSAVFSLAFSPDGMTLATGDSAGTLRLWNVERGQPFGAPLARGGTALHSLAFSPDGAILAAGSADQVITLWNVAGRDPRGELLLGYSSGVYSLAFSPDGTILASGSEPNERVARGDAQSTIVLWDVASQQRLGELQAGHEARVSSIAFSPDGLALASGGWDNAVMIWDMAESSWRDKACARANRNLSAEEWRHFFGDDAYHVTCDAFPPGVGVNADLTFATPADETPTPTLAPVANADLLRPVATPVASPMATPVTSPIATPVASPVASPIATPPASPIATPVAGRRARRRAPDER